MTKPKITVGIPVYNESKNIGITIDSILKQAFADLEILISDNCSTDNTLEIIEGYAKNNPKIRILKHERNRGAIQNWNGLVDEARGEYLVIAGAHDLWSDDFLINLCRLLDNNPDAVLAFGKTVWIDENGHKTGKSSGFIDTSGYSFMQRYNSIFWGNQNALYGAYKLSALKKTRRHLNVFASGAILLSELSILGDIIIDSNAVWYRRETRGQESTFQRIKRYYGILFTKKRIPVFPYWKFYVYYLSIPFTKYKISFMKRILLLFVTLFSFFIKYHRQLLFFDSTVIIKQTFNIKK